MEFLQKLEEYQKEARTTQFIYSSTINRLPVLEFKFKNERPKWIPKIKDEFFESNPIKYVYNANNTKCIELIDKLKDDVSQAFLKATTTGLLDLNWLNTIMSEKKVGIPWNHSMNVFFTEIIFYSPAWDLEDYKKQVEFSSYVNVGKQIKSQYVKLDFYDKKFSNEKALKFLEHDYPIKSFYAGFIPRIAHYVEYNQEFKNILLQFLSLKKGLVIGGTIRFSINYLSSKINDFIILFSRFFDKIQISKKHVMFNVHGIKFFCDGFKGISDEIYNKLLKGLLSTEEYDIETIFKTEHKILDIEQIRTSLEDKAKYLIEYYQQHPEIKNEMELFENAQIKRTSDAISKYFI
jgi:hypothetical protein